MVELLVGHLIEIAFVALGLYAAPKLAGFVSALGAKYNVQTAVINQQRLEAFILQQILRVKEEVAAAAKDNLGKVYANGDEKLESVISATLDKFPGVGDEEAERLTRALLATVGEGATVMSQAAIEKMLASQFGPPDPNDGQPGGLTIQ